MSDASLKFSEGFAYNLELVSFHNLISHGFSFITEGKINFWDALEAFSEGIGGLDVTQLQTIEYFLVNLL